MSVAIEALDAPPAVLGECPVWAGAEGALYWIDIEGRAIHRHVPDTGHTDSRPVDGRPGSFVLTSTPGRLLVAVEHELVVVDWDSGAATHMADLEEAGTGNRLNDGRCDPAGRSSTTTPRPGR